MSVWPTFFNVVVKYDTNDAFVVTAYLTDQLKDGAIVWPKK